MRKTFCVAWREFVCTVLTKGFIIGVVVTPLIMFVVVGAIVLVVGQPGPHVVGAVAVVDKTGVVGEFVKERFSAPAVHREQEERDEATAKVAEDTQKKFGAPGGQSNMAVAAAGAMMAKEDLTVDLLDPSADIEAVKKEVASADGKRGRSAEGGPSPRLVLAVITPETLHPTGPGEAGLLEIFQAPGLNGEIAKRIHDRLGDAVVNARIAGDPRTQGAKLDPVTIRKLMAPPMVKSVTVTAGGEKKDIGEAAIMLPAAFMLLLMTSVLTGGQSLLTTVVEEKSSRVMEVLLSAVSPMQLMSGKIIGQMGVGLLILTIYSGLGMAGLVAFALQHLVTPLQLTCLFVYFFIAFFLVASMMAAVGSAVNEMREAQTLMTPIMLLIMLPWLLWMPIQRAPNSMFSTVLSFIPGPNPFVMIIRLTGSEAIPTWQIPASIAVGILSVFCALWFAAKVFRIGVLMYGKPPNMRTLIKWVRMA